MLGKYLMLFTGVAAAIAAQGGAASAGSHTGEARTGERLVYVVRSGTATFRFATDLRKALGFEFVAQGDLNGASSAANVAFSIEATSTLRVETEQGVYSGIVGGALHTRGALLLDKPGVRVVIGNLAIEANPHGLLLIKSTLDGEDGAGEAVFELESVMLDLRPDARDLRLIGELSIARSWAQALGFPEAAGTVIGTVVIEAGLEAAGDTVIAESTVSRDDTSIDAGRSLVDGSDILVAHLSVGRFEGERGITPFAVGTTACNIGNRRANWVASSPNHPVIAQNAYRLKDDRFEQIGMSWLKHGFFAVSQSLCTECDDHTDGTQLGVGCSDPYSATLNGMQTNMSPRSTVNVSTGEFPYPWPGWEDPAPESPIERRLQIHNVDLDPRFNVGARYFIQGHYILQDDVLAGTSDNNASYREVLAENPAPGIYQLTTTVDWDTQRGQPAVRAWQDVDASVEETDIRVPGEGLFILAAKAAETPTGTWRYSYALQNLDSDQSGDSFSVPLPPGALMANVGFHDVDYHSGDPYDDADWQVTLTDESITWSVAPCEPSEDANALRFGTVYSFYFESDVQPAPTLITIGLFKPGTYSEITGVNIGPKLLLNDCNNNSIPDACDLDCDSGVCEPPCGDSPDCNLNEIPDECELDCNDNSTPDDCDVDVADPDGDGEVSDDCQRNGIPDECEFDCDNNGVPDDCEIIPDDDGDGVNNCDDLCPALPTTLKCWCPERMDCCFPGWCYSDLGQAPITREACLLVGGVPTCTAVPCHDGCQFGDFDANGTLDLFDIAAFQNCMGSNTSNQACIVPFDGDADGEVSLVDYVDSIHDYLTGP